MLHAESFASGELYRVRLVQRKTLRVYRVLTQACSSIIEMNPDILAIASEMDAERAAGHTRGPLHGIPFLVKDNMASKDKLQTTAGSLALEGSEVPRDAFVVSQLRKAGGVLMGKATMSEWAGIRSTLSSPGYSARGGQSRSAYNLTVSPGSSSTGSAIAVSNNVVAFALGTETDGSIIDPAERNAVVGIKPTLGLTSRAGVVPVSLNQDTVGTFGRTVRDAVYALDAIHGVDPHDSATSTQAGKTPVRDYASSLSDRSALKGAKLGIPWDSFWVHADPEQLSVLLDFIDQIASAGATVVNGTEIPNYETTVCQAGWDWKCAERRGAKNESEYTYCKVDFYNDINSYLTELSNTTIRTLADIVKYNNDNAEAEGGSPGSNPAFPSGQDGLLDSLSTGGIMDATYHEALAFCQQSTRENGIDAALKYDGGILDALLVPTDVAQSCQTAAQAGYPVLTLPAGVHSSSGMPYGFGLMGTAFSEATLIKYASAIEDLQMSRGIKRPMPKWLGYTEKNIPVINQYPGQ